MEEVKLVSAGDDIKIWGPPGYTLLHQFNPHSASLSSTSWSKDAQFLASASSSGDKIVLTYTKNSAYNSFDLAIGFEQTCVAFSSNSQYILTGGKDKQVSAWDLKTQKLKQTYKNHKDVVSAISFNWNDTYIASGSVNGEVLLHSLVTGQGSSPLIAPKVQAIRDLEYSHFKKSLLGTVSDDGAVNLWDTNTRRLAHSFNGSHKAPATGLAFSPINEMLLMSVGLDKRIICYDLVGKSVVKTLMADSPLTSIDFMHDGATLVVGTTRGKVHVYDFRSTGVPIKTLLAHKSSVQSLAFQPLQSLQNNIGSRGNQSSSTLNKLHQAGNHITKETLVKMLRENKKEISHMNSTKSSCSSMEDIFSPLKDGLPDQNSFTGSRGSENRPDLVGSATPMPSNVSSDIFSPLLENGISVENTEKKTFDIGDTTILGTRPVPTGLADSDIPAPSLPKIDLQNSILPSATATSTSSRHQSSILISDNTKPINSSSQSLHNEIIDLAASGEPNRMPQLVNGEFSDLSKKLPSLPSHLSPEPIAPNSDPTPQASGLFVQEFQMEFIKNTISDMLEDFKDAIHKDIQHMHSEMIWQFQVQLAEMEAIMKRHSINEDLVAEIERLSEENRQLKTKY